MAHWDAAARFLQSIFHQLIATAANFMALPLLKVAVALYAQRGAHITNGKSFGN
jgi:hypothetical protein